MKRIDNTADTVSIWPQLSFFFSAPLRDSSVRVTFTPSTAAEYNAFLNAGRDTLTIQVTGALDGHTCYLMAPDTILTAENGNKLYPGDAEFLFCTYQREQEPNTFYTADTLFSKCFGTIAPVHDTDYYILPSRTTTINLTSYTNKAGLVVRDSVGQLLLVDNSYEVNKTIAVSPAFFFPLKVGVYSLFGNDTRYMVGVQY
jgi:hypothetical protein